MEPSEDSHYVRLRGIPWAATKEDVVDFLKGVNVCDGNTAVLFTIADGGRKCGEAVVAVQTKEDAERAMACNRNYMGKRWVEVVMATREEFLDILGRMAPKGNEFVVRLRGLPYAATVEDIKQFFAGISISPNGVVVVTDDQGRCGGDAYVEFSDSEAMQNGIAKHRNKMGNRFIEVFSSTKGEMLYVSNMNPTPLMNINTRKNDADHNLGAIKRTRFVDARGFGGDSPEYQIFSKYSFEKYIHLRNLPFSCSENDIVDFFAPIQVISLSMLCDDAGKFTGMADAYFETDSDAIRAVNENKGRMGRRMMELTLRNRKVFVLGRLNPPTQPDSFGDSYADIYNDPPPKRYSMGGDFRNDSAFPISGQLYDPSSRSPFDLYSGYYNSDLPTAIPPRQPISNPYGNMQRGGSEARGQRPHLYEEKSAEKVKPVNFFPYY